MVGGGGPAGHWFSFNGESATVAIASQQNHSPYPVSEAESATDNVPGETEPPFSPGIGSRTISIQLGSYRNVVISDATAPGKGHIGRQAAFCARHPADP